MAVNLTDVLYGEDEITILDIAKKNMKDILDVDDNLAPTNGQLLVWNNVLTQWEAKDSTTAGYSLPIATDTSLGGVKSSADIAVNAVTGEMTIGNYPSHAHVISDITNLTNTLSGIQSDIADKADTVDVLLKTDALTAVAVDNKLITEADMTDVSDVLRESDALTAVSPTNKLITEDDIEANPTVPDEVQGYANLASFPVTGVIDTIYLAQDTTDLYVWDGAAYVLAGGKGTITSVNGDVGPAVTITKADISLGDVDNTADAVKAVAAAVKFVNPMNIELTGDVVGNIDFDGESDVQLLTTITDLSHDHQWSDISEKPNPILTIDGDANGSATFVDMSNTTLTLTIVDDSHNHIIDNIDGLQPALDDKVDDSQVLTDVPVDALFTDTVYDDADVLKESDALTIVTDVNKLITETDINELGIGDLPSLSELYQDTNEPSGFVRERPLSMGIMELSTDGVNIHRINQYGDYSYHTAQTTFGDGTTLIAVRKFVLYPVSGQQVEIYIEGIKNRLDSTRELTLADSSGMHFIYFDPTATLQTSTTFSTEYFEDQPIVSVVYLNRITTNMVQFGDERHGIAMDGATHRYLHFAEGTKYISGLGMTGLTEDGTTHGQVDAGEMYDEDIVIFAPSQALLPFWHINGETWDVVTADNVLAHTVSGDTYICYNEDVASTWQLTELGATDYAIVFMMATSNAQNRVVKLVPQGFFTTVEEATGGIESAMANLLLTGLPSPEFVFLSAIVVNALGELQLQGTAEYLDLRQATISVSAGASGVVTDHTALLNIGINTHDEIDSHIAVSIVDDDLFTDSSIHISHDGSALSNDDATSNDNIAIGANAGEFVTTASDSIYIGREAGQGNGTNNVTGTANTGVGTSSLQSITDGFFNAALGVLSGKNLTTGYQNVLIGPHAGYNLTTGGQNIYIGLYAGNSALAGSDAVGNIAIGEQAGYNIGSGSNNTLIGAQTGSALVTGGKNVCIGFQAGNTLDSASNSKLRIADNGTTALIEGDFVAETLKITGDVEITKTLTLGSDSGSIAISQDGSALANDDGTANDNIAIGINAGEDITSGWNNVLLGEWTGRRMTIANNNICIGSSAGAGSIDTPTTGSSNFFAGSNAGLKVSTGSYNTAIGVEAGTYLTTGLDNILVGRFSGNSNVTDELTGDANLGLGTATLRDITSGSFNTAIGNQAGNNITTGNKNVLIGYSAGDTLTTENSKLRIADNGITALIDGDFVAQTLTFNGDVDIAGDFEISSLTTTSTGDTLVYDGAKWVNQTPDNSIYENAVGIINTPLLHLPLTNNIDILQGVGKIVYTCASITTQTNRYGYLQYYAIDEPRLSKLGYLSEAWAENQAPMSEDFSDSSWTKNSSSISSDNVVGPDGTTMADTLVDDATNDFHEVIMATGVTCTAGTNTVLSCFVKAGTKDVVMLTIAGGSSLGWQQVGFDMSDNTWTSAGGDIIDKGYEELANGWYRIWIEQDTDTTTTTKGMIRTESYVGIGADALHIYGVQLENKQMTSYMPNYTTAPVSRNKTQMYIDFDENFTGWQEEATYAMEIYPFFTNNGNQFLLHDGISNSNGYINYNSTGSLTCSMGDSTIVTTASINTMEQSQVIFTQDKTNIKGYLNSILFDTDASTTNVVDKPTVMYIGSADNSYPFNGYIKNVRVWDTAFTPTQILLA